MSSDYRNRSSRLIGAAVDRVSLINSDPSCCNGTVCLVPSRQLHIDLPWKIENATCLLVVVLSSFVAVTTGSSMREFAEYELMNAEVSADDQNNNSEHKDVSTKSPNKYKFPNILPKFVVKPHQAAAPPPTVEHGKKSEEKSHEEPDDNDDDEDSKEGSKKSVFPEYPKKLRPTRSAGTDYENSVAGETETAKSNTEKPSDNRDGRRQLNANTALESLKEGSKKIFKKFKRLFKIKKPAKEEDQEPDDNKSISAETNTP